MTQAHLEQVGAFYENAPTEANWASRSYRTLLAHYYNLLIPPDARVLEIGCGSGELLAQLHARHRTGVDLSSRQIDAARRRLPDATFHVQAGENLELTGTFDCIVISETLNLAADAQQLLQRLQAVSHPGTRLMLNVHSSLWRPVLTLARWLGIKSPQPQSNWLATADVLNLLRLSDWESLLVQPRILLPVKCAGLETACNRWLAPLPLLRQLCLTVFCVASPRASPPPARRSVSVIIPARNEAGNIEAAVRRTPELGSGTELIFVEGHSRDQTWEEIQRVEREFPERRIKIMQQTGRGKGDAVRLGFAAATGDILMILDADLTMPPEELPKFYDVLAREQAEFVNGCRLVYPMDEQAMQFLNLCANKTFGLIFTWLLGQPVKDTLCGTKALSREHYEKIAANRAYFGDFDPFGDFDLLFGAAKINLKIADVPIRYRERTYGTTNIQRWKHGWLLLRMVVFAARKLKFV
ncbi:MAG TPA: bifunctional class I SAM-dependent methyltransferase/glycosyltransferase family 2 protein [Bryobacteraceae bacterium]|nr:bifunctional class I SAM-dependent methyltransferase/glycosyltransferase family 2 protein [Bryobacteraceae bacterium]